MSFSKKWWLSFSVGFALALALLTVYLVWGAHVCWIPLVLFFGFCAAMAVSALTHWGHEYSAYSDAGSRGNPYCVEYVAPHPVLGGVASGWIALIGLCFLAAVVFQGFRQL